MSGFRKFRSNAQRRRRTIEAVELGHIPGSMLRSGPPESRPVPEEDPGTPETPATRAAHQDLPADREAVEIGPQSGWFKNRKPDTDH